MTVTIIDGFVSPRPGRAAGGSKDQEGTTMTPKESDSFCGIRKAYFLAGIFTAIPIVITWWVVGFILKILRDFGQPTVDGIAAVLKSVSPEAAALVANPWFDPILAVLLALLGLYFLGYIATRMIGRRLLELMDQMIKHIPLVRTVYGAVQKFMAVVQQKPDGVQRVVLIEFPSPEMKTVGFVTRTIVDEVTGEILAVVYVPTTPNPTSGYLEIVPLDKVVSTDWTMDEAMTFVMSGGAVAPARLRYYQEAGGPGGE